MSDAIDLEGHDITRIGRSAVHRNVTVESDAIGADVWKDLFQNIACSPLGIDVDMALKNELFNSLH